MATVARRARRAAHIRAELLKAAARAFSRRGLEATTMQEIATEAGYTVASLYAYFDGKQEIINGLIAFLAGGVIGPLQESAPRGLGFAQRLELVLRRQLEFAEGLGEGLMVFFAIKPEPSGAGGRRSGTGRMPAVDLFVRQLAAWIERSSQPQDIGGRRAEDVAYLLKAILHAVFLQWVHGGSKGRLADRAPVIVDLLLHGVGAPPPGRKRARA